MYTKGLGTRLLDGRIISNFSNFAGLFVYRLRVLGVQALDRHVNCNRFGRKLGEISISCITLLKPGVSEKYSGNDRELAVVLSVILPLDAGSILDLVSSTILGLSI